MKFDFKEHIKQILGKTKSTPNLCDNVIIGNDKSESLQQLWDKIQSEGLTAKETVPPRTDGSIVKLSVDELRSRLAELSKNPVSEELVSSAMCYSRVFPKYITSEMKCELCHYKITYSKTEDDYHDRTIVNYVDEMTAIGYPVKLLRVCDNCAKKQLDAFSDVSEEEISHIKKLIKETIARKYQADIYDQPVYKEMLLIEMELQGDPIAELKKTDYANALLNYKQCEQILADYKEQIGTDHFHHLLMAILAQQQTLSERNYLFAFPLDGGKHHYALANDTFYYKTLLTLLQGKSSFEWTEDHTTKEKFVGGQLNILEYMTGLIIDE